MRGDTKAEHISSSLVAYRSRTRRSYLGAVSHRTLDKAKEEGVLSVARPVLHKDPSMLDAMVSPEECVLLAKNADDIDSSSDVVDGSRHINDSKYS